MFGRVLVGDCFWLYFQLKKIVSGVDCGFCLVVVMVIREAKGGSMCAWLDRRIWYNEEMM